MNLVKIAAAGTMESGDVMITITPMESGGITLDLTSSVMQQYGRQIEQVIRESLAELGVENAQIKAVDKGALDCTIRARVTAAAMRSAECSTYTWEG